MQTDPLPSIRIEWSVEDEAYIAVDPERPWLSAFGDSRMEALREFEIVEQLAAEVEADG